MLTIAVGGLHHETNTFAPSKATLADFLRASGWPGAGGRSVRRAGSPMMRALC